MRHAGTPRSRTLEDHLVLLPLRQRISEKRFGVRGLHLHRAGHEGIEHRYVEDREQNVYSVTKTVTALAIGIARGEGLLDLGDRLVDHVRAPEGGYGRGVDGILLRHLLTMTAGNPVTVFVDEEREHVSPSDLFLGTDLVREPGEAFEYSNGGMHMLSRVITERTGTSLRDYLLPRLFAPLGIVNPQWFADREGLSWGGTGLQLKTPQLARIGRLLLQRGSWDGEQLVPAAWIDAMHAEENWVATGESVETENLRYGFGVWECSPEGAWRADGAFGQFLLVLPRQQAVLTVTSHHEGSPTQDIVRAVWQELLPLL